MKYSRKRIILTLSPLIFLNIILAINMLWVKTGHGALYNPEYNKYQKIDMLPKSQVYSQGAGFDQYNLPANDDKVIFQLNGDDADCWKIKNENMREQCYKKFDHGGSGTLTMGGNSVVNEAQAVNFNGFDGAGYHWLMSSSSEPYGNAMGFVNNDRSDVVFGNNLVVNGGMKGGGIFFNPASTSLEFSSMPFAGSGGGEDSLDMFSFNNTIDDVVYKRLMMFGEGVCGECGDSCDGGNAGKDYRFYASPSIDIKGNLKLDGQFRICGFTYSCEEACCRLASYVEDDTYDDLVGYPCPGGSCSGPPEPPGCSGGTFCNPQPYKHYVPDGEGGWLTDCDDIGG